MVFKQYHGVDYRDDGDTDVDKKISEIQNEIIEENRAAKLEFGLLVLVNVSVELVQRLLDIPYFSFPSAFLGDCSGLEQARAITKPVSYYVLYILIEIFGACLFTMFILGNLNLIWVNQLNVKPVAKSLHDGKLNHRILANFNATGS